LIFTDTNPGWRESLEIFCGFLAAGGYSLETTHAMATPERRDFLSAALHDWRLQPCANPGFRATVRERLGLRATESWPTYLRAHGLGWSVAAMLVAGVAGWTGRTAAKIKLETERDAMAVAYLVELDPRVQARLRR